MLTAVLAVHFSVQTVGHIWMQINTAAANDDLPEPLTADLVFTGLHKQNPFLYVSPKWTDPRHQLPHDWEFATHRLGMQQELPFAESLGTSFTGQ